MSRPTDDEINDEIDRAVDSKEKYGTQWSGMSYEEGVDSALRWALGETDEKPMDG